MNKIQNPPFLPHVLTIIFINLNCSLCYIWKAPASHRWKWKLQSHRAPCPLPTWCYFRNTCANHLTYCENAHYSAAFKIFHLLPMVRKRGGEVAAYQSTELTKKKKTPLRQWILTPRKTFWQSARKVPWSFFTCWSLFLVSTLIFNHFLMGLGGTSKYNPSEECFEELVPTVSVTFTQQTKMNVKACLYYKI